MYLAQVFYGFKETFFREVNLFLLKLSYLFPDLFTEIHVCQFFSWFLRFFCRVCWNIFRTLSDIYDGVFLRKLLTVECWIFPQKASSWMFGRVLNTPQTCVVLHFSHCVKSVQIRSFSWYVFSCIRSEYGDLLRKSSDSVRIRKNTDQKKLRVWTLFTQWQRVSESKHVFVFVLTLFFVFAVKISIASVNLDYWFTLMKLP